MNKYYCAHCKKIQERDSGKNWIKSYCEETGKDVRLQIISPFGIDILSTIFKNERKNSDEWYKYCNENFGLTIKDPDGWDREHYEFSWYEEKITAKQFLHRVLYSTCIFNKNQL